MSKTCFNVNGQIHEVDLADLPADITLNTFLREHAQLTATKFMCLEGGCGACVVVIRGKHPVTGQMRTWAANSCLTLLNVCIDWEIVTCEGLGDKRVGYHPIQKRLAKMNGTQCGFCSPGFVMNMYGLLESQNGKVTMNQVENSFGGNLCRCTGYRPILDAMKSFASDSSIQVQAECLDIEDLNARACPKTGALCRGDCQQSPLTAVANNDGRQWHKPKNLPELFDILDHCICDAEYMLVAGNTAHGVYRRSPDIKDFIDINGVPELKGYTIGKDKITLGANLTLHEAMEVFIEASQMRQGGFEYCQQMWDHFDLIANVAVRNMGTLAGNIWTKKIHPEFPSDVYLLFETLDVQLVINEDAITEKRMPLAEYLSLASEKHVIKSFELKAYPKENFLFRSYKIMPRAQNAHAYVNAAFLLNMEAGQVKQARICFGGIRPDFTHATSAEKLISGTDIFQAEFMAKLFSAMSTELQPDEILPDTSPEYRVMLAAGLLYKLILSIAPADKVKPEYQSGGTLLQRPLSSGQQSFETHKETYPLTQPVGKLEGMIQTSGEAKYMNDTLTTTNAVYCAFATATRVGATIEQIDASEALAMCGVIAFFSAKDIPGTNTFVGPEFGYAKEEIFCSERVAYYDQPLGVIVAKSSDIANLAATKIKVFYSMSGVNAQQKVLPTLHAVLEAGKSDRIVPMASLTQQLRRTCSITTDIQAAGIFDVGVQFQFAMEPLTTVVVPFEDGLKVWSTTQWMDHTQSVIANMLQMRVADVQLEVRRLGGGFGFKITRGNQVACAASLVAHKLNLPVRFILRLENMMNCYGKRWACRSEYEAQVKATGKIVSLTNKFFEDAGCTLNENPVDIFSLPTAKSCYDFTDATHHLEGQAVLTDAPSASWCRAPGSVEGIAMIENIMEHIAFAANIDPVDARLANIKADHKMAELLPRFVKSTEYRERRSEIDKYNEGNRWLKRGLGAAIMEYPIDYFGQFTATVAIYHSDGTVVITHGGIEMGQGMNTKIAQVAAFTLSIPLELIKMESSETINGANSFVTGGSIGTESVCFAVRKACQTLNDRLKPIKESLAKDAPWKDVLATAWGKNVNTIASEQYKMGDMQHYVIYGLALTEIAVDILTGNHQIRRVDILQDTGDSISPYIDIGQVEGAFVMLLGYWLTERLVYDRQTGELLTNRTWTYKVPGAKDIPIDFRIELLQKNPNTGGILRSKATGEPPACLAVSSIFAVQHALQSARKDAGLNREWVRLGAPTTPETIVLNAGTDVKSFTLQ